MSGINKVGGGTPILPIDQAQDATKPAAATRPGVSIAPPPVSIDPNIDPSEFWTRKNFIEQTLRDFLKMSPEAQGHTALVIFPKVLEELKGLYMIVHNREGQAKCDQLTKLTSEWGKVPLDSWLSRMSDAMGWLPPFKQIADSPTSISNPNPGPIKV